MLERRIARHTRILAASGIAGAALSFAIVATIGRILGENGLGAYAVPLAYAYPLTILADFGLSTLLLRETSSSANALMAPVMVQRLTMGGIVMLTLIILSPGLSADPIIQRGIVIAAPLVLINPAFSAFSAALRAADRVLPPSAITTGMLVSQAGFTLLLLWGGGDVLAALALNTLTSTVQLAAVWAVWRFHNAEPPSPAPIKAAGADTHATLPDLFWRALPFAIGGVLAAFSLRAAVLLLEGQRGTAETGLFTAANRLIDAAKLIPTALYGGLFPALAGAGPGERERAFWRGQRRLIGYGLGAGLALAVSGPLVLLFAFGPGFAGAIPPLAIMSVGLVLATGRGGALVWCYAIGHQRRATTAVAVGLVVLIGCAAVLTPAYGGTGAASAVVLGDAAAWAASVGVLPKRRSAV